MRTKIYFSDVQRMLHLFAPKHYDLHLFDPELRLEDDADFPLMVSRPDNPRVLVSLADEVSEFRGIHLQEFDLILDFGKTKTPDAFKQKSFRYLNNPDGTMRWLCAPKALHTVLPFYNAASLRPKLIQWGLKLAQKLGLQGLVTSGSFTLSYKQPLKLETAIEAVDWDNYSIFTGTAGYHRTAVIALQKAGATTHFAKVAYDQAGVALLANEQQHLSKLEAQGLQEFTWPQQVPSADSAVLITTNETPMEAKANNHMGPLHEKVLTAIFEKTKIALPLYQTHYWDKVLNNIKLIKGYDSVPNGSRIKQLLEELKAQIDPSSEVVCTLAHSDFTPWNMKLGLNSIYLYDWELAQPQVPALFDLFHFHFQTGIFSRKGSYNSIMNNIEKACERPAIKHLIVCNNLDVERYLKLYLMRTVSFYLATFEAHGAVSAGQVKQLQMWETALRKQIQVVAKTAQRRTFITDFHAALQRTPHAFLKFTAGALEDLPVASDLDIAVLKEDIPALINYCEVHQLVERVQVIKKSFMSIIEIHFFDGSYLSVDAIHQFKRKGLQMMLAEPLLRSAQPNAFGVRVPDMRFDLEYALLFYALNGAQIPEQYLNFYQAQAWSARIRAMQYLGEKYQLELKHFSDLFAITSAMRRQIKQVVRQQEFQKRMYRIRNRMAYLVDTCRQVLFQRGFIVTLSGVDGVGKSTILDLVQKQLQARYRREVVVLRHRPRVLPILSSLRHGSVKKAENAASETDPRQGSNHSTLSSVLRFSYYYADYLLGQFYIYFRYLIRGKIVLFDRYYFDFIADSERSNIRLNRKVIQWLYAFVLKPRLNVLLWAKPQDVFARKQELSPDTISMLTTRYKKLFDKFRRTQKTGIYRTIENKAIDQTVSKILQEFGRVA